MRSAFFAVVCGLTLTACGTSTETKTPAAAAAAVAWEDSAMQELVAAKCATSGCHDGTQAPNFATITEANMEASARAKIRVEANTMPPSNASPLSAAEKTIFLNFYN